MIGRARRLAAHFPAIAALSAMAVWPVAAPGQVLISPNQGGGNVSVYSIGSGGSLSAVSGSPVTAGVAPTAVATLASANLIYVTNGDNTISAYLYNPSTGGLSPVAGSPFSTSAAGTYAIAISPVSNYLFVTDFPGNKIYSFTFSASGANVGALTPVSALNTTLAGGPNGIAVDPTGHYLYVTNLFTNNISGYSIGAGATLTALPGFPVAAGLNPSQMVIAGGVAYVPNYGSNTISAYAIGGTGALTQIGAPYATGHSPQGLTVDPSGSFLYVPNQGDNTVSVFTIGSGGTLTPGPGAPVATGSIPFSAVVDPSGQFLYVSNFFGNSISAYSITASGATRGALTAVAGSPFAAGDAPSFLAIMNSRPSIPPSNPVPALSTWAMLALGVMMAGMAAWKLRGSRRVWN